MYSVFGMGNPLMDLIVHDQHAMLVSLNAVPGSMNLVDSEFQNKVLSGGDITARSPGGSCANTLRGFAWLQKIGGGGEKPVYCGAVGHDTEGDLLRESLTAQGVEPSLAYKTTPTGTSAIVVTPDSERTMFTHLGACRDLEYKDVDMDKVSAARYFHTTGYMWDTQNQEEAAVNSASVAKKQGLSVSFDIADPFVIERYRDRLVAWMPGNIDVLFANREEMKVLTGCVDCDTEVIKHASEFSPLVVMKVGKDGCILFSGQETIHVPGDVVECVDTTGAGDAFAGGFLYGLITGKSIYECGRIANTIAAAIVTIPGCSYENLPTGAADIIKKII
jgi:sugar/nucleoside kinase (ribokinase family)